MLKQNLSAKKLTASGKKNLIKQVENALELATILCYEQGISLISKTSKEFDWKLNLAEITRIWQGGCIIRSSYLKDLTTALNPANEKLALSAFQKIIKTLNGEKQKSWRKLLSLALESGIPVPAFYACLGYFDSYAKARLPQNLIQAQRDFFGAHGYERTDKEGSFHTEW
jgi:6-phosphogluconate dehydrogenase